MSNFSAFAKAVNRKFTEMSAGEIYEVELSGDVVFDTYLAAFPLGTNPIFRQRTEHDCSCCKQFIRNIGNVVAIENGALTTVWDIAGLEYPYDIVAAKLSEIVRGSSIRTLFRTSEPKYGAAQTTEITEDLQTRRWNHFWCDVPRQFQIAKKDIGTKLGEINGLMQVFRRGMEEITLESVEMTLDMIDQNLLYRGTEFRPVMASFKQLKLNYPAGGTPTEKSIYLWSNYDKPGTRMRNSAIGTLVQDLSDGVDTEKAVRSFETKVAPLNYKRPTAVVTKRMVDDAVDKLKGLGLESAIKRRHAKIEDISVNDVLFVDNGVRSKMKDGGLADLLMEHVKTPSVVIGQPLAISMEDFLKEVVPQAESIELKVENKHLTNFVSVTAPAEPDAGRLFKWDNGFAWSYDGDAADSVKQRVKKAGGNVDNALLRVSLSWFNTDDLDLHCEMPGKQKISFASKGLRYGVNILDVDMNVSSLVRDPVENLSWTKPDFSDGVYTVYVHQYCRRETVDVGFAIEIESGGQIESFSYSKAVQGTVPCFKIHVKNGVVTHVEHEKTLVGGSRSQEKWGVKTETLVPIETLLASPNHWDGEKGVGNKHWFFVLKDCKNPEPVRGIYNEYLRPDLEKHRKVFELVGAKTKVPVSDEQLSGVGFSSTNHDKAVVVVKGSKLNRSYEISF